MLRAEGYTVDLVDYDQMPVTTEAVKRDLHRFGPDIVGVSVLTGPQLQRSIVISDAAKDHGCRVIWGGPHATILPEGSLLHRSVDGVVLGEGEEAVIRLLRYWENPASAPTPYGCGVLDNGKPVVFPAASKLMEMDDLPMPAWDLLPDIDRYVTQVGEDLRVTDRWRIKMNTSRSCVYKCSFCYQANDSIIGYLGKYRALSPKRVVREMEFINDLTSRDVSAWDFIDMLTIFHRKHSLELAQEFIDRKLDIRWYGSSRHSILTEDMIQVLRRSGCEMIFFGIEAGSPRILKMIRKPLDVPRSVEIGRMLGRSGIYSIASYIMGFPTETLEDVEKTLEVMNTIPVTVNVCQVYLPIPGTPSFDQSLATGRFTCPTTMEEWVEFVDRVDQINVSDVDSEVLFPLCYEAAKNSYLNFYLKYQWDFLKQGKIRTFVRALLQNRVNEEIFRAA
jgi:radical SAM superfamily enzyme YgiQ (UPF0313 family)